MAAQLEGKVAIVTGSSAGLGEAIALLFASRGARVTLCGRDQGRLRSVLDKAVSASGGHKDRFLIVHGDVTDQNVRKQIVDQTVEKFGRLDILVANAGITVANDSSLGISEDGFDIILNTNLKSVLFLIQQAVPHLEKTRGNIVNMSSFVSYVTSPDITIYSISKAALDQLTRCLAVDLGPKGIRVNSVNPGFFPTLILREVGGNIEDLNRHVVQVEESKIVLGGRVGVNNDVAEAVLFLASDAAGYITSEFIKVDGGRYSTGPFCVN
jgi:NAD(P)-dependent dehydrogenase (short-subunit alcohol dehydrogenase family)